jgi:hypothetical protein
MCGASCANVQVDDANCGDCGVACMAPQRCAGGQCR